MTTIAPYGSWRSPISAHDLAESGHPISGAAWVGDDIWWLEARPGEAGRYAVRTNRDGEPADILPAPWNARTRVHEYGGGAWTVTAERVLVFAEFTDQRLYRLDAGSTDPTPLTPADAGFRFAELSYPGRGAGRGARDSRRRHRDARHRRRAAGRLGRKRCQRDPLHRFRLALSGLPAVLAGRDKARVDRLGASADALGRHRASRRRPQGRHRRKLAHPRRFRGRVGAAAGVDRQCEPHRDQRPQRLVEPRAGRPRRDDRPVASGRGRIRRTAVESGHPLVRGPRRRSATGRAHLRQRTV